MFLYSKWLSLPLPTRHAIAAQFHIIKRGSTEVFNDTIKSDGYVITEVEGALNVDALQKYLGSEATDMALLWELMVAKIEGRDVVGLVSEPTSFNGKPIEPRFTEQEAKELDEIINDKRFCEWCDSKGKRHKKECTRTQ